MYVVVCQFDEAIWQCKPTMVDIQDKINLRADKCFTNYRTYECNMLWQVETFEEAHTLVVNLYNFNQVKRAICYPRYCRIPNTGGAYARDINTRLDYRRISAHPYRRLCCNFLRILFHRFFSLVMLRHPKNL